MTKEHELSPSQEQEIIIRPPVSVSELFIGDIPPQTKYGGYNDDKQKVQAFYEKMAREPIHPRMTVGGNEKKFTFICPPLAGKELQHFFHYAAPSKTFGLDYEDTKNDWVNLYDLPSNTKRLASHKTIHNWELFESHREFLWEFIQKDRKNDTAAYVIPIAQLHQKETETKWMFEDFIQNKTLFDDIDDSRLPWFRYLSVLGPLFVAAYSPDTTKTWGKTLNYQLTDQGYSTNDMGATQVLPLTLAKSPSLIDTPLIQRLITYAETGELPPSAVQQNHEKPEDETTPLPKLGEIYPKKNISMLQHIKWHS